MLIISFEIRSVLKFLFQSRPPYLCFDLQLTDNLCRRPGVSTHMLTHRINHHLVSVTNGWGQRSVTNTWLHSIPLMTSSCVSTRGAFWCVLLLHFLCEGNVICRPCAPHDGQICVAPFLRHTDEVIHMGLRFCSKGLAVELTFRSPGALPSIFVTHWQSDCLVTIYSIPCCRG